MVEGRLERLERVLEDQPAGPTVTNWVLKQSDTILLNLRDEAVEWAGPVTVAQQELKQLGKPLGPGGPYGSHPLMTLIFGALSTRELNRRLGARVEAALADPPAYMTAVLGSYPSGASAQLLWTHAVSAVEAFRMECGITDPDHALGPPDVPILPSQHEQFFDVNRLLTRVRVMLEQQALAGRQICRRGLSNNDLRLPVAGLLRPRNGGPRRIACLDRGVGRDSGAHEREHHGGELNQ